MSGEVEYVRFQDVRAGDVCVEHAARRHIVAVVPAPTLRAVRDAAQIFRGFIGRTALHFSDGSSLLGYRFDFVAIERATPTTEGG